MKLAFLGLGVMGFPMAGHLQKAGHSVTVYNRNAEKSAKWVATYGGSSCKTPREAAVGADIVMMCVGNDDDVRSVVYGADGALSGMKSGATLVDHTTASATLARELDAATKKEGKRFIDAPVSGGQAGAENGKLGIMCGGAQADFDAVKDVLNVYAKALVLIGDAGAGQLTKMVNQICIAGLVQALSEGLAFASKAGVDPKRVLEVISKGAAQSWQMENRGTTMIDDKFDFGFAVDWMRKDLGICLDEAKNNGAKLPITALIDQFYGDVQSMGGNRWDTSSLIKRLK
ncbi:MAG: NAD(P)-dependent oxidoreductase [Betaproteobacteria bacterium]|nr:MAG: NAD(P)-dependent oxidoreductase [Betaproteobacteria bacterium]